MYSELMKLDDLLKKGIITKEEFEEQKKKSFTTEDKKWCITNTGKLQKEERVVEACWSDAQGSRKSDLSRAGRKNSCTTRLSFVWRFLQ